MSRAKQKFVDEAVARRFLRKYGQGGVPTCESLRGHIGRHIVWLEGLQRALQDPIAEREVLLSDPPGICEDFPGEDFLDVLADVEEFGMVARGLARKRRGK